MAGVMVSQHFGIIVRIASLRANQVSMAALLQTMEVDRPLDQDEFLISFGPHFGGEAATEFSHRLEKLGLRYGEDFIDFADTLPAWCQVYVALSSPSS